MTRSAGGGRLVRLTLIATLGLVAVAGCGTGAAGGRSASSSGDRIGDQVGGRIIVFAAASLAESFTTLGQQFEAEHPGTSVTFSFGPSSGLAEQINQGAPADVFASASTKNMDQVKAAGNAVDPTPFAVNVMEVAVPADNPGAIHQLSDLAAPGVKVAVCQPQVPCGTVAATVFHNARLTVKPVSLEADVKSVLSKVVLGEVDAGVVYVTDVRSAGDKVHGIEIPREVNASTAYPITTLKASSNVATASAFVDFVRSPAGSSVLRQAGFGKP